MIGEEGGGSDGGICGCDRGCSCRCPVRSSHKSQVLIFDAAGDLATLTGSGLTALRPAAGPHGELHWPNGIYGNFH